jgi:pimeloyl-ACP methyl ester carboxylesterase
VIVLVHSGITDAGMWDGFELEGEVTRHHLSDPISVDAPVVLVGASYGGLVSLDFAAREPDHRVLGAERGGAPAPDGAGIV